MRFLRALLILVVVTFAPVAVYTQAPDRSHPPQPGPAPALRLPAIQKRTLANGLPVWVVEHHEVPIVQINLVVLSGTGDDPQGKYGIASLTASMLTEGAGKRSALEIADAIDYLGADLDTNSGSDASAVRLSVPVARLADALPIMADVIGRPTFPEAELARQKVQRLTIPRRSISWRSRVSCTAGRTDTARLLSGRHRQFRASPSPTSVRSTKAHISPATPLSSWWATSPWTGCCCCSKRTSASGRRRSGRLCTTGG
jgi:zinc protease